MDPELIPHLGCTPAVVGENKQASECEPRGTIPNRSIKSRGEPLRAMQIRIPRSGDLEPSHQDTGMGEAAVLRRARPPARRRHFRDAFVVSHPRAPMRRAYPQYGTADAASLTLKCCKRALRRIRHEIPRTVPKIRARLRWPVCCTATMSLAACAYSSTSKAGFPAISRLMRLVPGGERDNKERSLS